MPAGNAFQHQTYTDARPLAGYQLLRPELPRPTELPESAEVGVDGQEARAIRAAWGELGLQGVYLVHGTFTGNDSLGLLRQLKRFQPDVARTLQRRGKQWVDLWLGDCGNYSASYVEQFQRLIQRDGDELPVTRFAWSGENNHTGRCEAAVELLAELLTAAAAGRRQLLLWGHSHAGNVFALLTNLLGGDRETRREFCRLLRLGQGRTQRPEFVAESLDRVEPHLLQDDTLLRALRVDIVTFGTPVRYGWETRGYRSLLHIVHHRPVAGRAEWLAPFPFGVDDLLSAHHGDYIQQLGIAGTDFVGSLFSRRGWLLERRFSQLLQPDLRRRDTVERLRLGMRVPAEGHTWLVDYPQDALQLREQLAGHAIYTQPTWLPFHLRLITESATHGPPSH